MGSPSKTSGEVFSGRGFRRRENPSRPSYIFNAFLIQINTECIKTQGDGARGWARTIDPGFIRAVL